MSFGANIKKIRKTLKLTQDEFAKLINVSQRTISHYEQDDCLPDLITLCRLADACSIKVESLIGYNPNEDEERFVELKNITLEYHHQKLMEEKKLKEKFPF